MNSNYMWFKKVNYWLMSKKVQFQELKKKAFKYEKFSVISVREVLFSFKLSPKYKFQSN